MIKSGNSKILFLFTQGFPIGKGEQFISNEINFLSEQFAHIYICPYDSDGLISKDLPFNISIIRREMLVQEFKLEIFFKNFLWILSEIFRELKSSKKKAKVILNYKDLVVILITAVRDANWIRILLENKAENQSFVLYSFWMNNWTNALSFLKKENLIKHFVFRTCGYDVFEEQREGNYIPLQMLNLKSASKIYPNCKEARKRLLRVLNDKCKISVSYLGTKDYGIAKFDGKNFKILSIASLVPVKRILSIIKILKNISFDCEWTHIGDGTELLELMEKTKELPQNIHFNHLPFFNRHEDLISYLKDEPFSIILNVSSSEGMPVTLQEAISLGIPVLATEVGGNTEIIELTNGILVPQNFDPIIVAKQLEKFKDSDKNSELFRAGIRDIWKDNFSCEENYSEFASEISNIKN